MNCEAGIFVNSAVRASPWLQLFHAEQKKCPLVMIWRMLSAVPAGCMQSGGLVNSAGCLPHSSYLFHWFAWYNS